MAVEPTTGAETARLSEARERYVAGRRRDERVVRRARPRRDDRRRRRSRVHRLRRRHRRAERRTHPRAGGRGDPRAGGALPAPVLLGRDVRAVRRGVPAHLRAASGHVRDEGPAAELRRRGRRERGQDRPLRDRARRDRLLRPGVPRPHAAHDDADLEGHAVQEGLRAVRARGVPRGLAVALPRDRHRRGARVGAQAVQEPGRSAARWPRSSTSPCRARADSSRRPRDSSKGSRRSAASTGSCTSTTRCSRGWVAPARCSPSTTSTASSPISSSGARASAAACRSRASRAAQS